MIYFWIGFVGIMGYCVGYVRGMLFTMRDYHKFMDKLDDTLDELGIVKTDNNRHDELF